jgi:hypothetical protein
VYVAWGPVVAVQQEGKARWILPGEPPPASTILPTEIDQYMLAAYSPLCHPAQSERMAGVKAQYEAAMRQMALGEEPASLPLYAPGIDWEHAEVVLTAGEGDNKLR